MDSVEVRAAKFGALAEPARLRIVDLLVTGDLSPSEIQDRLSMPSNLVAHHLRVLESTGILTRSRSESDRRRNYVRLRPEAFDELAPEPIVAPTRVVFVCTANSARSQMAHALWLHHSRVPAASAGTEPAEQVNEGAVRAIRRHGIRVAVNRPRHLESVLAPDDLVIAVCDRAHERLAGRDSLHWSIPDPAPAGTETAFDAAFADLRIRVEALAQRLMTPLVTTP